MRKHLFLSHLCLLDHGSSEHPENANRLRDILAAFDTSSSKKFLDLSNNRLGTFDEVGQVHDLTYINHVRALEGQNANLDHETILSPGSVKAAFLAAGLGIELVEQVLEGKIQDGFAFVRPPGHHARPAAAMGFCVFNNIAIAARKALSKGIKRILILDWDVHHGNGTQETFYEDDRVLFIDLHQENLFPQNSGLLNERGKGLGLGFTVNIPLPPSCRDADYLYAFDKLVKPLALQYRPELILVSAGFDAHESDPLGSMNLTTHGFGRLAAKIKSLANDLCGGKMVFFLEGGYNTYFLAKNVMECVDVLINETSKEDDEIQPYSHGVERLINEIYDSTRRNT